MLILLNVYDFGHIINSFTITIVKRPRTTVCMGCYIRTILLLIPKWNDTSCVLFSRIATFASPGIESRWVFPIKKNSSANRGVSKRRYLEGPCIYRLFLFRFQI